MGDQPKKLSFDVVSRRLDAHGSVAHCKSADITLDIDLDVCCPAQSGSSKRLLLSSALAD